MSRAEQTIDNGANDWTRAWFDFVGRMAAAGFSVPPDSTSPPAAAKHMRDTFLQAMSASCDQYLRSPEFLQMMKASIPTRRQRPGVPGSGPSKMGLAIFSGSRGRLVVQAGRPHHNWYTRPKELPDPKKTPSRSA